MHGNGGRPRAKRAEAGGWRWYQPDIGRFVQRDPVGIWGGLNVYAYCTNDPLLAVDPEGLGWWDGVKRWVTQVGKKAGSIIKKAAQGLTGHSPKVGMGVVGPIVQGSKTAPNIARIHVVCTVRQRLLDDLYGDSKGKGDDEAWKTYKKNHGRYIE